MPCSKNKNLPLGSTGGSYVQRYTWVVSFIPWKWSCWRQWTVVQVVPLESRKIGQMMPRGPFQPQPCCDSGISGILWLYRIGLCGVGTAGVRYLYELGTCKNFFQIRMHLSLAEVEHKAATNWGRRSKAKPGFHLGAEILLVSLRVLYLQSS